MTRPELRRAGRMKIVKAVIFVIFLMAIFLCIRVFFDEPVPRKIAVYEPITHGLGAKVAANTVQSDDQRGTSKAKKQLQREAIADFCTRHPELSKGGRPSGLVYRHLLFENRHRLLYCFVPKVGCTSLKPIIETLSGAIEPNSTGRRQIHGKVSKQVSLANISEEERDQVLQTHFKFMILRDPVERMLSAYKDKLEIPLSDDKRAQSAIKRNMFKRFNHHFDDSLETLQVEQGEQMFQTMSFKDYLSVLQLDPVNELDQHFMPMSHMCNPCVVDYDFYGNFRTLTDDIHHVLDEVGAPQWLYQRRIEHSVSMRDFMDLYFGEMSTKQRESMKKKLTKETGYTFEAAPSKDVDRQLLQEVFKKYATDFDFYYSLFPDEEWTYERYIGQGVFYR